MLQVSAMIQQFDDDIADDPEEMEDMSGDDFDIDDEFEPEPTEPIEITPQKKTNETKRRPPPPLISISDISSFSEKKEDHPDSEDEELEATESPLPQIPEEPRFSFSKARIPAMKRPIPGCYPPALSIRGSHIEAESRRSVKRCRVDLAWMGLDQVEGAIHSRDILTIARARCQRQLFHKMRTSFLEPSSLFSDLDLIFSDGKLRAHRLVLAACSPLLTSLLADPSVDCLVFPEVPLSQGRTAVEALYTGSVVIDRRAGGSLAQVEGCVRAFQEVGLLENYTVQLLPKLPLRKDGPLPSKSPRGRCRSGKDQDEAHHDTQSHKVESKPHTSPEVGSRNGVSEKEEDPVKKLISPVQYSLRSPKKGDRSPSPKKCLESNSSPSKPKEKQKNTREDCNKPRFAELTEDKVKQRSGCGQKEVVDWLMETGFLSSVPPSCKTCCSEARLTEAAVEDADGWEWSCCAPLPKTALREHSIFQYSKESLTWIVRIILCWRENTSLTKCHQVTSDIRKFHLSIFHRTLGRVLMQFSSGTRSVASFLASWKMRRSEG